MTGGFRCVEDNMTSLYGVGGYLRSGKDAFADQLVEKHGFVKLNMSDPLVEATNHLDPWIRLDFDVLILTEDENSHWAYRAVAFSFVKWHALLKSVGYVEAKKHKDVREFLQKLGTQVGRNMFDENVWSDIAARKIEKLRADGNNVVVTGVRFQNELDMIFDGGGTSVWISRPGTEPIPGGHESENSLNPDLFERVIQNDGSLKDFRERTDIFHQALSYSRN